MPMATPKNTVFYMEAANLFCGDHDPSSSKHLSLEELKLPDLVGKYADHAAGGSPVDVEIQVGVEKLQPTFKLKGFDPELVKQFGMGSPTRRVYTAYGVLRDLRTGAAKEGKAIMEGRLGRIAADAFKRGEAMSEDYAINEVMHYELFFDQKELLYWDFFTTEWRVDSQRMNGDTMSILRIPT
jgi:uncharacterized protein